MRLKLQAAALAVVLLAACLPAAATLGEDASSVAADQTQLQAALRLSRAVKFSVHQLQLPSGTTVNEYVSPAGMVFAVSWQGPSIPDLQQVLGRYFDAYVAAMRNRGSGNSAPAMQPAGFVAQSGGHMRAFYGRAYVASMLPRGVLAEEIK